MGGCAITESIPGSGEKIKRKPNNEYRPNHDEIHGTFVKFHLYFFNHELE